MYMQVTRGRIDLARFEEARETMGREVVDAIKQLPGCQSYTVGFDRDTGRTCSITTWDTEEHARWAPDALGDIPSRLRAFGLQLDLPEIFEVVTPS